MCDPQDFKRIRPTVAQASMANIPPSHDASIWREDTYLEAGDLLLDVLDHLIRLPAVPATVELARKVESFLAGADHKVATADALRARQSTVHAWAQATATTLPLLRVELLEDKVRVRLPTVIGAHASKEQGRILLDRLRAQGGEEMALNWDSPLPKG